MGLFVLPLKSKYYRIFKKMPRFDKLILLKTILLLSKTKIIKKIAIIKDNCFQKSTD